MQNSCGHPPGSPRPGGWWARGAGDVMATVSSWHGHAFRVTCTLWGESTGLWWIYTAMYTKIVAYAVELSFESFSANGPLTRYVKLPVAHAPGMPGTFSPAPWISDPGMHHGTYVTHVPWCMPGSITSGFLWSRRRGKRSRHSRRMRNPHFAVSGKRPMVNSYFRYTAV